MEITKSKTNEIKRTKINFNKILKPIVLYVLAFIFFLSWVGSPELLINLTSSSSDNTQIFYESKPNTFLEEQSFFSKLQIGNNNLNIPLPSLTKRVRWDPIDGPGKFVVNSLRVKVLFSEFLLSNESVTARTQIANLTQTPSTLVITTIEDATDPSVYVNLPYQKILGIQLSFAAGFALMVLLTFFWTSKFRSCIEEISKIIRNIVNEEKINFEKLPLLILIAVLCWFSSLASYSISIDDEFAVFRQDQSGWAAQGRWTVYLLTRFLLPQPVIPFLPHAIFCISASISYLLIARAHKIPIDNKALALFPMFMALPIWYFIAEFYANLLAVSVGLILTSLAVVIFSYSSPPFHNHCKGNKNQLFPFLIQSFLLCLALGTYQSYIFVFFSMGVGVIIFSYFREKEISIQHLTYQAIALVKISIVSTIFYWVISWIFKLELGVDDQYIDGFVNPAVFFNNPWRVIRSVVVEAAKIYTGSSLIFGVSLSAIGVLMVCGTIALFQRLSGWKNYMIMLSLVMFCVLAPFSLNLLVGGAGRIPYRSMVGIPYVIWFFSLLAVSQTKFILKGLAVSALGLSIFQIINAHSVYQATRSLALEHDKVLAAEIYHRIVEKVPTNSRQSSYKVDFYGAKSFVSVFPKIPTSTIGSSFFDWDGGNPWRIAQFMKLIGYEGITIISVHERQELSHFYKEMPRWPAVGAVQKIGDVFLVKLGDVPSYVHAGLR